MRSPTCSTSAHGCFFHANLINSFDLKPAILQYTKGTVRSPTCSTSAHGCFCHANLVNAFDLKSAILQWTKDFVCFPTCSTSAHRCFCHANLVNAFDLKPACNLAMDKGFCVFSHVQHQFSQLLFSCKFASQGIVEQLDGPSFFYSALEAPSPCLLSGVLLNACILLLTILCLACRALAPALPFWRGSSQKPGVGVLTFRCVRMCVLVSVGAFNMKACAQWRR